MRWGRIAASAKQFIDKRGGTESLKQDAEELRRIAKEPGSMSEKAKKAAGALKEPGAGRAAGEGGAAGEAAGAGTAAEPAGAGTAGEPAGSEPAPSPAERAPTSEDRAAEEAGSRQGAGGPDEPRPPSSSG